MMQEGSRERITAGLGVHLLTVATLCACLGLVPGLGRTQGMTPDAEATGQAVQSGEEPPADPEPAKKPQPKWACDQQTATAEPVWRGAKNLTFAFDIRNQGTADLNIKARGG